MNIQRLMGQSPNRVGHWHWVNGGPSVMNRCVPS